MSSTSTEPRVVEIKSEPIPGLIYLLEDLLVLAKEGKLRNIIYSGDLSSNETKRGMAGVIPNAPLLIGQLFHLQYFLAETMKEQGVEEWKPVS